MRSDLKLRSLKMLHVPRKLPVIFRIGFPKGGGANPRRAAVPIFPLWKLTHQDNGLRHRNVEKKGGFLGVETG